MMLVWGVSLTGFETLNLYVKYINGDPFVNFLISGLAETFGQGLAAILFVRVAPKMIFFSAFLMATIGGLGLILDYYDHISLIFVYICEAIGMFGIAMNLCGCFVATPLLFDI